MVGVEEEGEGRRKTEKSLRAISLGSSRRIRPTCSLPTRTGKGKNISIESEIRAE